MVETLYVTFEGIVGKHMIPKVFSLIATLVYLYSDGQLVRIGSGRWHHRVWRTGWPGPLGLKEVTHPLLRPANADLNMTLGMALFFMAWWLFWTIQEVGVVGFLKHIFAPKGDLKGVLWYVLLPLFIFVGIIEVISIAIRPVSLSFRLFGNIYAGETLLHTMGSVGASLPTSAELDFSHSISASVLLPRAVGRSAASLRFRHALRRLYQALD